MDSLTANTQEPVPNTPGVIKTKGKVKYRIINDEHKPKKQ